jgi:hypothetical protein
MLPALGKVAVVFVIDSDSALKENKYKIGVTELVDIALLCSAENQTIKQLCT